jgi:hypothetical protein
MKAKNSKPMASKIMELLINNKTACISDWKGLVVKEMALAKKALCKIQDKKIKKVIKIKY